MRKIKLVSKILLNAYLRLYYLPRYSWPIWFHIINKKARNQYEQNPLPINSIQQRVVVDLNRDGISVVDFSEFFPDRELGLYQELVEERIKEPVYQSQIKETEAGRSALKKHYMVHIWDNSSVIDLNDDFVDLSLSDEIMGVVCRYLGQFCKMTYQSIWYNAPLGGDDVFSQRWHRDGDDRKIVKVFLYLRDVDDGTGPTTYVTGTHGVGRYRTFFPQTLPFSRYTPDGAVEDRFSPDEIRACTGRAGTLIFCDTTGLHKGGNPISSPRVLFTSSYYTEGVLPSMLKNRTYRSLGHSAEGLSSAADYAIS